ncbi:transglutaminase-like domain-containing protein [Pseudokineococcus sp. 5B2Z-1]|uniref:transglutaminase-like domain-containing protein n=1 Tax=Pseudokineococcus sp. 5B2Z-1 TaxID=3132744 RepID=UPI0030B2F3F3
MSAERRPGGREGVPPGAPSLLAGAAVLAAALSLLPLVDGPGWFVDAVVVVVVVGLVGVVLDALTSSALVRTGAQVLAALMVLTALYAPGSGVLGLLPGPAAFASGRLLVDEGMAVVRSSLPPVADPQGLRLLVVGGVGAVAVAVDVLAVRLGRVSAAGAPLLALVATAAALQRTGLPVAAFVVAAVPYLLLLRAESRWREGRWGRTATRWRRGGGRATRPRPPLVAAAATAAVALLAAVVVPALGPWGGTGLLGAQGWGGGPAGSGPGGARVNPLLSLADDLGERSDATALTYRLEGGGPATEPLRLVTVDVFDGDTWRPRDDGTSLQPLEEGVPEPPGLDVEAAVDAGVAVPQVLQVQVAALRQEYLPAPYPATAVELQPDAGAWGVRPGTLDLVGEGGTTTTEGQTYAVRSLRLVPDAADLVEVGGPPASVRTTWTELPDDLPPEIGELAEQVAGDGEPLQRVARLQAFFRDDGGFTYSEEAPGGTGAGSVAAFLDRRSGYCVHFASAMALMARSLGLPARVSVGFLPGTAQADGSYRVRLSDAHAWPEVYLGSDGWVRFEPTPGVRTGAAPRWSTVDAADAAVAAQEEAQSPAPAPAPAPAEPGPAGQVPEADGAVPGASDPAADAGAPVLALSLVAGALLLVLALGPAAAAGLLRRRRWRAARRAAAAGSPTALVERAEDDLRRGLADLGLAPQASDTPRAEERRRARLAGVEPDDGDGHGDRSPVLAGVTAHGAGEGTSPSRPTVADPGPASTPAPPPQEAAESETEAVGVRDRLRRQREALEAARYGVPQPQVEVEVEGSEAVDDRGRRARAAAREARADVDVVLAAVAARRPRRQRWRARWVPLARLRR